MPVKCRSSRSQVEFLTELHIHKAVNRLPTSQVKSTISPSSPKLLEARSCLSTVFRIDKVDVVLRKNFGDGLLLAVEDFVIVVDQVVHAEHILSQLHILGGAGSEVLVHTRVEVANQEM